MTPAEDRPLGMMSDAVLQASQDLREAGIVQNATYSPLGPAGSATERVLVIRWEDPDGEKCRIEIEVA